MAASKRKAGWLKGYVATNKKKSLPRWGKKGKQNNKEAEQMHPHSPCIPTARVDVVAAGTESLSAPAACEAGT